MFKSIGRVIIMEDNIDGLIWFDLTNQWSPFLHVGKSPVDCAVKSEIRLNLAKRHDSGGLRDD